MEYTINSTCNSDLEPFGSILIETCNIKMTLCENKISLQAPDFVGGSWQFNPKYTGKDERREIIIDFFAIEKRTMMTKNRAFRCFRDLLMEFKLLPFAGNEQIGNSKCSKKCYFRLTLLLDLSTSSFSWLRTKKRLEIMNVVCGVWECRSGFGWKNWCEMNVIVGALSIAHNKFDMIQCDEWFQCIALFFRFLNTQ